MTPAELRGASARLKKLSTKTLSESPGSAEQLIGDFSIAIAALDTLANFLDEPSMPDTEVLLVAATQRAPAEPLYCEGRR